MVISRTPFRISFFGGGTDYPAWYRKKGGVVLAATIDKYCYINARYLPPFFGYRYRIAYNTRIENCKTLDQVIHPSVREVIRYLKIRQGVDVHYDGDLPARSGLGSSSAFTVGMLHALYALGGQMPNKRKLSNESIYIEQKILKETVGSQDQVLAAHGGFNLVTFHKNKEITLKPMTISSHRVNELQDHLMLFYTGIARKASDIAKSYVQDIENRQQQLDRLQQMVPDALTILNSKHDINEFGKLLDESWQIKRTLSSLVSNPKIDELYKRAVTVGAVGGKLLGAGGGGFLLLFVPPSHQAKIKKEFSKLIYVPFKFEYEGSQIIFFDQQNEYTSVRKK